MIGNVVGVDPDVGARVGGLDIGIREGRCRRDDKLALPA